MHPRAIITNAKFVYRRQRSKLVGLLKYFQHRNQKEGAEHVRQFEDGQRVERWIDQGLGDNYKQILHNSLSLATTHLHENIGARLLVIAPEVHLMEAIPAEQRLEILKELTEQTVEGWFERLDLPTAAYSYVIHEAEPANTRPDGRLKDETELSATYLHSHVVLAATVPGLEQDREGYKVYERQLRSLHAAGQEALAQIWERELGAERVAELNQELAERTQRYLELDQAPGRDTFEQTTERTSSMSPPEQELPPPTQPNPPPAPDLDVDLDLDLDLEMEA